jgi:hypothetical protein
MSADDTFQLHADKLVVARDAVVRHRASHPQSGPVTVTKVNPLAWAFALTAAGGDITRISVMSATEIVVANSPAQARAARG